MSFLLLPILMLLNIADLNAIEINNIEISVQESFLKIEAEIARFDELQMQMNSITAEMAAHKITYSDIIASATSDKLTKEEMDRARKEIKGVMSKIEGYARDFEVKLEMLKKFHAATENSEKSYREIVNDEPDYAKKVGHVLKQLSNKIVVLSEKEAELEAFYQTLKAFQATVLEWNDILSGSIRLSVSRATFKWDKDRVMFSSAAIANIGKEFLRIPFAIHEVIKDSEISQPKTKDDALLFLSVLAIIIIVFSLLAFLLVKQLKGRAYDINNNNFIIIALINALIVHRWAVMFLTFILSVSAAYIMILDNIPKLVYVAVISIVGSFTIWRIGLYFIHAVFLEKHGQLEHVPYDHRLLIGRRFQYVYTILCILALFKVPKYAYQISGELYHTIYFIAFTLFICFALLLLWKLDIKSFVSNQNRRVRFFAGITRLLFLIILFLVLCSVILEGAGFIMLSSTIQKIFIYNFITLIMAWIIYVFGSEFINLYYLKSIKESKVPVKDSQALRDLGQLLLNSTLLISSILLIVKAWTTYIFIVPSIMNLSIFTVAQFNFKLKQLLEIIGLYFMFRIIYVAATYTWDLFIFDYLNIEKKFQANFYALTKYTLIFLFLIITGGILGVTYKNLVIIAGALGVGIGFGLQNIANNFISGLIMLFERPIRVGDVLQIDGDYVTVIHIGSRSTTVSSTNDSNVIIPNSEIISNKLINWTLSDNLGAIFCDFEVDYGTDLKKVRNIVLEVMNNNPKVLKTPSPPNVYMTNFGENGIKFSIKFRMEITSSVIAIRSEVLLALNEAFEREGIKIPYPHRDILIRKDETAAQANR